MLEKLNLGEFRKYKEEQQQLVSRLDEEETQNKDDSKYEIEVYAKKTYYSNKAITSCVADFEFYDNYVREITQNGETKLEYSKIYKIIETKTNFYIMASVNQGFIIVKSNCSDGLIDFIKSINSLLFILLPHFLFYTI